MAPAESPFPELIGTTMTDYLNIDEWSRKNHYHFFKNFDNPFFNICADVTITPTLEFTRKNKLSFFIATIFLSTTVANSIAAFRYRLREEGVLIHPVLDAGSTVLNVDETFSFGYFRYTPEFQEFHSEATEILQKFREGDKSFDPADDRDDMIHYSVIPWIRFTAFTHARNYNRLDSTPKIVFGKRYRNGKVDKMPVSVAVHHALMDGIHVGRFFERFEAALLDPKKELK